MDRDASGYKAGDVEEEGVEDTQQEPHLKF